MHRKLPLLLLAFLNLAVAVPCADAQEPDAAGPRFAVTGYRVEGDNPLPQDATQALLAPFTGDNVTLDRLQAAAGALETELRDRGYGFLRVIVPPQDARGTITLRVLAFKLNAVKVGGNQHFDTANILRSLPALKSGETPNLREIARNQAHANDHPAKQVNVTIRQGTQPDTVDADVKVEDSNPLQVFAMLNNSGNSATGVARLGVGVSHTNLFGRDHAVTATYTTSPDHAEKVKQYGVYYRAPFYGLGGTLSAYYSYSDSNSGTVANFFNVSGRGEFAGLRWTQRLQPIGAYSHLAEIGIEDRFFKNDVTFNNVPIGVDVRTRPLLARYEGRFDGADYGARYAIEWVNNLSGGGSNTDASYLGNRAGASPNWQAWRYTLDGSRAVAGWIAGARLRGQISSDALVSGEQFALGGAAWVRGLEEREGNGDKGYVTTVEVTSPPLIEGARGLVFVDTGEARLNAAGGAPGGKEHATSAGVGVRWNWRKQLSLAADWAYVFDGAGTTNSGDNRFHASLVYRF